MEPSKDRSWTSAAAVGAVVGVLVLPTIDTVLRVLWPVTSGVGVTERAWSQVHTGIVALVGPGLGIVSWVDAVRGAGPYGKSAAGYIEWVPVFILNGAIFAASGVAVGGTIKNARLLRVALTMFWLAWLVMSVVAGMRDQFPWQR
jgi:hypothetical protein